MRLLLSTQPNTLISKRNYCVFFAQFQKKLNMGVYTSFAELATDARLIVLNCIAVCQTLWYQLPRPLTKYVAERIFFADFGIRLIKYAFPIFTYRQQFYKLPVFQVSLRCVISFIRITRRH